MNRRRLLYYILLNIFVSALVTGTILFFYDRSHRLNPATAPGLSTLSSSAKASAVANTVKLNIVSIVGAGRAASEMAVIQNDGTSPFILTGWSLKDSQGNAFIFPQLTLYPGGTIQVHTAGGDDTAVDLYWGRTNPVWTPGELAALYDPGNVARVFYRVP